MLFIPATEGFSVLCIPKIAVEQLLPFGLYLKTLVLALTQAVSLTPTLFVGSSGVAGVTPRPKAFSVRVIAAIWWLFTIALLAAYIANFTALLSSGSEQLSIQTFEDLVKQRKLEFGTLDGSSTFYFFKVQKI